MLKREGTASVILEPGSGCQRGQDRGYRGAVSGFFEEN